MAPTFRCSGLAHLVALTIAVFMAAAAAPASASWSSRTVARPDHGCGACGSATWLGRCVPSPAACAATPGTMCEVRAATTTQAQWWWRQPRMVYSCVPPPTASGTAAAKVAQGYLASIRRVYEPLLGMPEKAAGLVISGTAPNGTFAAAPVGRIYPLGVFSDLVQTLEYFYGIISFTRLQLLDIEVAEFVASPPYAFAKINLPTLSLITNATAKASHIGMWRFDDKGLITGYDLNFAGLTPANAALGTDYASPTVVREAIIPRLCANIEKFCNGDYRVYESAEACVRFLTPLPVTRMEEGNIAACRAYHAPLARFRPDVHCAHVGPSGGGKCVDKPFETMYKDDTAMLGLPWVASGIRQDQEAA
ncbi:hypothetical protein MMPV_007670 [Pyropia vietnamensis]